MKPRFANTLAWQQAELLMQPAFIRILDRLRQHLENSEWKGTYQEIQTPFPGYQLVLQYEEISVTIDIWDLCYQVCFRNYSRPPLGLPSDEASDVLDVEIDLSLIDDDTNEVDWQLLDDKANRLIEQVFASLPALAGDR
jgi:hypothetical protein